MTVSAAAVRRFDAMLARAVHTGTPVEEARTALEGARRVANGHDIPRAADRIRSAEAVLGLHIMAASAGSITATMANLSEQADRLADIARGTFDVVRGPDGKYRREYRS